MADTQKSHRKRSYDATFKLIVVSFVQHEGNRSAGRHFGVNERQVRDWSKQQKELESLKSKKKRLEGGGRKAAHPVMEDDLVAWIESLRTEKLKVTRADIQRKALELL